MSRDLQVLSPALCILFLLRPSLRFTPLPFVSISHFLCCCWVKLEDCCKWRWEGLQDPKRALLAAFPGCQMGSVPLCRRSIGWGAERSRPTVRSSRSKTSLRVRARRWRCWRGARSSLSSALPCRGPTPQQRWAAASSAAPSVQLFLGLSRPSVNGSQMFAATALCPAVTHCRAGPSRCCPAVSAAITPARCRVRPRPAAVGEVGLRWGRCSVAVRERTRLSPSASSFVAPPAALEPSTAACPCVICVFCSCCRSSAGGLCRHCGVWNPLHLIGSRAETRLCYCVGEAGVGWDTAARMLCAAGRGAPRTATHRG